MDDLFAALAAHLRRHNPRLGPSRARVEETVAGIWGEAAGRRVHCRVCGRPILDGDGLFDLEKLRADRACAEHYVPF